MSPITPNILRRRRGRAVEIPGMVPTAITVLPGAIRGVDRSFEGDQKLKPERARPA